MRGKKKPKKKKHADAGRSSTLTPDEAMFVESVLREGDPPDPASIIPRIPNARCASELIERLSHAGAPPVEFIAALNDAFSRDKQVRKVVKRAVFMMEKRGIAVAALLEDRQAAPIAAPREAPPDVFVGPPDGGGRQAVFIALHRAAIGTEVGLGLVSDERGIEHFMCTTYSKKQARETKTVFEAKAGLLVETTPSHVASLLDAAYARTSDPPRDYLEMKPRLSEIAHPLERPVIYDLLPDEGPVEDALTESRLRMLFDHPLMERWVLEPIRIRPLMEDMLNAEQSPIILNDIQKLERLRRLKRTHLQALFPSSARALWKGRFEEMAHVFFRLGKQDFSRLCLAAAHRVEEDDTVLQVNPVFEFIMDKSLEWYGREARKGHDDRSPGEQAPEAGRLILP